jgi:hypothetical protein
LPQIHFPFFPEGVTHINTDLAFIKRDGQVLYFNGQATLFTHGEDDVRAFRMITSQFCISKFTTQTEISRAFGVPLISVRRGVRLYRDEGPGGFFKEPIRRKGVATVLTPEVLAEAQQLLDTGLETQELAKWTQAQVRSQ